MNITDYDSKYLPEGWHKVKVVKYEWAQNPSKAGNRGLEIHMRSNAGECPKLTFWITDKAMYRLAGFAVACGLTLEERKAKCGGPTDNPQGCAMKTAQACIGREVVVKVERVGQYNNATDFKSVAGWNEEGDDPDAYLKEEPTPAQRPAPVAAAVDNSDLPF